MNKNLYEHFSSHTLLLNYIKRELDDKLTLQEKTNLDYHAQELLYKCDSNLEIIIKNYINDLEGE